MHENEYSAVFTELHKIISTASEVMAAFISNGKSKELPIDSLMLSAEQTLTDLTGWSASLKGVLDELELLNADKTDVH